MIPVRWFKRMRRITFGVLVGIGVAAVLLPQLRPKIEEYKEKLAKAIEEGREAARRREEELETEISQKQSSEDTPKYIV